MWTSPFYLLLSASVAAAVAGAAGLNSTHLQFHDSNFTPDFYLSVTYENHTVACQHRMSALVNGTSPGPTLRLPLGKTSWVRVCNNMDSYNTTMVFPPLVLHCSLMLTFSSTGMASLSGLRLSATAHRFPNGRLHHTNASTTRSTLNSRTPGLTSITPTLGFRLPLLQVRSSSKMLPNPRISTTKSAWSSCRTTTTRLTLQSNMVW